ncbi:type I restriction enzyme HsdR N-terminal domain-containing protein [Clostridium pasteurianum]|uniref:type I restriction enzyme HsdR N-terminal domain-containing protein n=1 Tax=Clostridium pasteurianum TaxID=1501 RepID=UPI0022609F0F|nr:type I restriction enzyme HsdR N-terminal domain-containing protein [Clostridium pasteurianum]UZW12599.1 type I restriction enzyme HsdR N-terminal domain-containing protein [Clostridium pasteurianum]
MDDIIDSIKKNFEKLSRVNEENIKVLIIVEVLKKLGYEPSTFDFEPPVYKRERADIKIQVSQNDFLYIETKRGDCDLGQDDIIQIAQYLNVNSIEWGILTNGKEYFLINNKIDTVTISESALQDKVVFRINLSTNKEVKFFKYLSKEAIFDSKVTKYFKEIAQFRAYKYPNGTGSWNTYRGTLCSFFTYYADKESKYRPLKEIRVDDFEQFLHYEQKQKEGTGKSVNALDTFNNKYSHIRSMFNELKKHDKIGNHNFEEERKKLVKNLNYTSVSKEENYLNYNNIKIAFEFLKSTERPVRNITLFLFSIFMGLERSTIRNLNWKMFNSNRTIINISGRVTPLPIKLTEYIKKLEIQNKEDGIKGNYVFYTYYGKKFNQITESAINDVFDRLKKIDEDNIKWTYFSPQYIRNYLVIGLFENGYSIEEIVYLTGMELVNISTLIKFDEICKNVNLKKKHVERKHPFGILLE